MVKVKFIIIMINEKNIIFSYISNDQHLLSFIVENFNMFGYVGDSSFLLYLSKVCSQLLSKHNRFNLILIDSNEHSSTTYNQLIRFNCSFIFYRNVSQLDNDIVSMINGPLDNIRHEIIFDHSQDRISNFRQFETIMVNLFHFYIRWINAMPFIVLIMKMSADLIHKWLLRLWNRLPMSFRAVLVIGSVGDRQTETIHIRPTLDGCLSYDGLFRPKNDVDFYRLRTRWNRCNLNSILYNVSVNYDQPFCLFTHHGKQIEKQYSVEMNLLATLEKQYNFRSQLVDENQSWGILINGTWSGSLGDVQSGITQIGLCDISVSEERSTVVDFSRFIYQNELTFITHCPGLIQDVWIIGKPLENSIWFCIANTILILSCILILMSHSKITFYGKYILILHQIATRQCRY